MTDCLMLNEKSTEKIQKKQLDSEQAFDFSFLSLSLFLVYHFKKYSFQAGLISVMCLESQSKPWFAVNSSGRYWDRQLM